MSISSCLDLRSRPIGMALIVMSSGTTSASVAKAWRLPLVMIKLTLLTFLIKIKGNRKILFDSTTTFTPCWAKRSISKVNWLCHMFITVQKRETSSSMYPRKRIISSTKCPSTSSASSMGVPRASRQWRSSLTRRTIVLSSALPRKWKTNLTSPRVFLLTRFSSLWWVRGFEETMRPY